MQARDATGRQVSLLNEDHHSYSRPGLKPQQPPSYRSLPHYPHAGDVSSYPNTPELLRSDSYDSNASFDPISPVTPSLYDYTPRPPCDDYLSEKPFPIQRPSYVETHRSNSFEEDSSPPSSVAERVGKRYPCRYRDSHGCEKTFTTSGHASRHSKIHTAEKAVQCTYPECRKKFTRADNMKQHLETHYKDKSRSSGSAKSSSASKGAPASARRASPSSSKPSVSSHTAQSSPDVPMWDVGQPGFAPENPPLSSPSGAWDMRSLNGPLPSRPMAARSRSGLDTLAAIACQEGS